MEVQRRHVYRKLAQADDGTILSLLEKLYPISSIAKRLGCDRRTLTAYIEKNETLRLARKDAVESLGDLAESRLLEKIQDGNLNAITWYLERRCPDRYGDRMPQGGNDKEPHIVFIGDFGQAERKANK